MSTAKATPRRVRVERNIYRRATGVFEVGFKDAAGVQRWCTVEGGITAARLRRDEALAGRGRGERVARNPRLRFGEAATRWLDGPVRDLRATTQAGYRNAVDRHLLPRFAKRRVDTITPDDMTLLVRDLRAAGMAESTITIVLGTVGRIYRYAARRLGWAGTSPVSLMLPSERPKPSLAKRRRIFEGEEVEQTIAAADEPWKTMLILVAVTGARISEVCGLTWSRVRLVDTNDAEIEFAHQVDRNGKPVPTKTNDSARTVPIPQALAVLLARHKLASRHSQPADYVFATGTGRPISQRNVSRALRVAQRRAVDNGGRPTFPILHERDESGRRVSVARGEVPSLHSFRHTFASRGLLAGESVDEIAFLLGHKDANVTRAVYVRELADARRRAMRRSRIASVYAEALNAAGASQPRAHEGSDAPSTGRRGPLATVRLPTVPPNA